jgi:DNA-binding transcriptional regulator YdaS (Cro superfamily)
MKHLIAYLDEQRGRRFELAKALGITPGAISQWDRVPIQRVHDIARITGLSPEQLRPDIFKPTRQTNDQ